MSAEVSTTNRAKRAKDLIRSLHLHDQFQHPGQHEVCLLADSTSSSAERYGPPPSIERLALLAYSASNKMRRRRAEWWLFGGKPLQAVRLLLDADAIVRKAAQTVDVAELNLVCAMDEEELQTTSREPSSGIGCIMWCHLSPRLRLLWDCI